MSVGVREADHVSIEPASVIPEGLVAYSRTPEFTSDTVPAALLKAHATKEDVWGRIEIVEGELLYRVIDPRRKTWSTVLAKDNPGVVEPTILHEVEPRGASRFFVEFFRK